MKAFAAPTKHGCKQRIRNQRPFTSRSTRVRSAALATEQSLLSTITSKGALFPKAELSISIATDEPVLVTSADVNTGEALLSVPEGLWLTPERAQRSSIGSLISGLEPWLQLALWILAEGDDKTSPIYPYVSSLPATIDSPLFWSADELRALEGTQILESTNSYMYVFLLHPSLPRPLLLACVRAPPCWPARHAFMQHGSLLPQQPGRCTSTPASDCPAHVSNSACWH
jgi:hypothetical protein